MIEFYLPLLPAVNALFQKLIKVDPMLIRCYT
jgi:hypothetical protein